ncbi:hypothetical protein [Priestia sp. GS2]|uniref:hypothetical protein n=1 Tax=Priestia sp. GS2 TaxID=3117403 RepID=UPI0011550BE7
MMYSPQEALLSSSIYFMFMAFSFIISFLIGRYIILRTNRTLGEAQGMALFSHFLLFLMNVGAWWFPHAFYSLLIFEFFFTTFISIVVFIVSELVLYIWLKTIYRKVIHKGEVFKK